MAKLRQALLTGEAISEVRNAATLSISMFGEVDVKYGEWLDQCVVSFFILSDKSKLASGKLLLLLVSSFTADGAMLLAFMVLFWKLSILLLAEQLYRAADLLPAVERQLLLDKARFYQRTAVTSLSTIAQRIVDVSALGEFKLMNSVQAKMQFICHHANTSLVALALSKAIEHAIDSHVSAAGPTDGSFNEFNELSDEAVGTDWIASMKPLLACLLTLDSTVSGAFTARPALQRLMQKYGDILMDSWSQEDGEAPS